MKRVQQNKHYDLCKLQGTFKGPIIIRNPWLSQIKYQ